MRTELLKPRRSKKKAFDPINALHKLAESNESNAWCSSSWSQRVSGRDLYLRVLNLITGIKTSELKKTHHAKFKSLSAEHKAEWYTLRRVIYHPRVVDAIDFPRWQAQSSRAADSEKPAPD